MSGAQPATCAPPRCDGSLTSEGLRCLLDYNPATGIFKWIGSRPKVTAGMVAGSIHAKGYRYIVVEGKSYRAGRLAWLYMNDIWPVDQIDHINGIRSDDRIDNLREATNSQNKMNTPIYRNNTVGSRGVGWHKKSQKYRARIQVNGKRMHLGQFDTVGDARLAYDYADKKYFGNFVRLA